MKYLLLLLTMTIALSSCNKEDLAELEEEKILEYIEANNLDAVATGTGLYYVEISEGTGQQPNANSTVTVDYRGYLRNGNPFDQSTPEGLTISLAQVIQGWQEGIPLMKEDGEAILIIPSSLGYGAQATGSIPANSILIFDVKLLDVL